MKKILSLLIILISFQLHATHLRSGLITVQRDNCATKTVKITVTVYTDTESSVLFGGSQDILDFGDGTQMLVPETPNSPFPGGGNIGVASFSVLHTYGGQGKYTISYIEPNRNAGVINIANSVGTTFYMETQIDISSTACSNSPIAQIPPINRVCVGSAFYYNPGAYDVDGDSLSYEFVVPFRDRNTEVTGYKTVIDPIFYPDFSHGNEAGDGPPTLSLNSEGTLVWDAPSLPAGVHQGEYTVAFVIKEWRKINGQRINIGFIRIDMQIIVEDCSNNRPLMQIPESFCVEAGTTINKTISGFDPENQNLKIELFSEIFNGNFPSPAIFQPEPTIFRPSPTEVNFSWNTTCDHIKGNPYTIAIQATDNPPDGPRLSSFGILNIKVVAPSPSILLPVVNVPKRHVQLAWDAYTCGNASSIQIWRKVGESSYSQASCLSGVPDTLGFVLIALVPNKDTQGNFITSYTDKDFLGDGVSIGVKYCYRIVAEFGTSGATSYSSEEICIDPIPVTAPMITNVSVEKTGDTNGEVKVRWTKPFEINEGLYPPPYEYIVQRNGESGFVSVSTKMSDTTFIDTGLNTRDNMHTYRIILYSTSSPTPLDTSSVASTIKLDLVTGLNIYLTLSTNVPWSNSSESFPMQLIYKGPEGSTEEDLTLLGSINSLKESFYYTDADESNVPGEVYCYRALTSGSYENDNINGPLLNYSQIKCGYILSISEESDDNIKLYPNPTLQFLKIEFDDQDEHEIRFYDQSGKLHFTRIERDNAILDLSTLTNGLYICEIRSTKLGVKTVRIIKN